MRDSIRNATTLNSHPTIDRITTVTTAEVAEVKRIVASGMRLRCTVRATMNMGSTRWPARVKEILERYRHRDAKKVHKFMQSSPSLQKEHN